ncbi:hypothetical protein D9M69_618970 [compost metagenome]
MMLNASSDACNKAPRPRPARTVCPSKPVPTPAAVITPALEPRAIEWESTRTMSWPGERMISIEVATNTTIDESSISRGSDCIWHPFNVPRNEYSEFAEKPILCG